MLGTGCAIPSKHRAPAAVYLDAFARGGVLLDVGEGSLGQLCTLGVSRLCQWVAC